MGEKKTDGEPGYQHRSVGGSVLLGVACLAVLGWAVFGNPPARDSGQVLFIRVLAALGAGGLAAAIPGFLNLNLKTGPLVGIKAGGALGIFALVFVFDPTAGKCSPNETRDCPCGGGLSGTQTCGPEKAWSACGCPTPDCKSGDTRECLCGGEKKGVQECSERRSWGRCVCPTQCSPGDTRQCSCPGQSAGAQECTESGVWSRCQCQTPFAGACTAGATEDCECSGDRTGQRTCSDRGSWGACKCAQGPSLAGTWANLIMNITVEHKGDRLSVQGSYPAFGTTIKGKGSVSGDAIKMSLKVFPAGQPMELELEHDGANTLSGTASYPSLGGMSEPLMLMRGAQ